MTVPQQSSLIAPLAFFAETMHADVAPDAGYHFALKIYTRDHDASTLLPGGLGYKPAQKLVVAVSRDLLPDVAAVLAAVESDREALAREIRAGSNKPPRQLQHFRAGLDMLEWVGRHGAPADMSRGTIGLVPDIFLVDHRLIAGRDLQFATAPAIPVDGLLRSGAAGGPGIR